MRAIVGWLIGVGAACGAAAPALAQGPRTVADLLLKNGRVIDGAGGAWVAGDVAISGARIFFVGHSADAGVRARDTIDITGLLVAPGFWDAHNHEDLTRKPGQLAVPFVTQGITTVVLGVDGFGDNDVAHTFATY